MASISECETGIDRISNLPTSLTTHILSFLSTEEAVKTSILSTHWNHQWALTSKLDIVDDFVTRSSRAPRSDLNFMKFVYRVLLFKATRLDLFRLILCCDYGFTNVWQWIFLALSRDVREIDLRVPMRGCYFEHEHLFNNKTLVFLTLGKGFIRKVPNIISLEVLKSLSLNNVKFVDGESLSRLVSSCLVLEDLKIEGKLSKKVKVLNISSPLLKILIIDELYHLRDAVIGDARSYKIVINTPSLQYFKHKDSGVPDGYRFESTLRCLDRAWLDLLLCHDQFDIYDDGLILARSMANLTLAISNVRILYLSECAFEAIYRPGCVLPNFQLPKFDRLTNLDIGGIESNAGLYLLAAFLQNSPQLASLSFKIKDEIYDEFEWDPPTIVPSCMLYNLKVIELIYDNLEPEPGLSMVKYFIEKTKRLEKLKIPRMKEMNEKFIKEVSLLPMDSKSCNIVFT